MASGDLCLILSGLIFLSSFPSFNLLKYVLFVKKNPFIGGINLSSERTVIYLMLEIE